MDARLLFFRIGLTNSRTHECRVPTRGSLIFRIDAEAMVPRNADIIQKNIEINSLQNVVLERKAVGSKDGKIVMTDESNAQVLNRKGGGLEVNITYLDKYVHLNPAFLKIDVEGFEIEVL